MPNHTQKHNLRKYIWLLVSLHFLYLSSCTSREEAEHRELLKDLPVDLVQHLISSDDSTLAQYGRDVGFNVLNTASKVLGRHTESMFVEGNEEKGSILMFYEKRIARVLASEYDYDYVINWKNYIDSLSPEKRRTLLKLHMEFRLLSQNPDTMMTEVEKLEKYYRFLEAFEEIGDRPSAALCKWNISITYDAIGNLKERMKYFWAAYADFTEVRNHRLICQALGEIAFVYKEAGKIDSMIICYEEALKIAHRHRLPNQAARIMSFYARHYDRQGRLSLAHDLYNEALELCREYKGGCLEVRYIIDAMNFQADLGCWEIVDQLLERARLLERGCENTKDFLTIYWKLQLLRIDQIEARLKMARGNINEATVIFQRTVKGIEELNLPHPYRAECVRLLTHWTEGLLDNGHPKEALSIIRDGFRRSTETSISKWSAQFALLMARAEFQLGNLQTSKWYLQQFDYIAGKYEADIQREWVGRDALLSKLELRAGDRKAALLALEKGLVRLRKLLMNMDAGAQSYLWISDCNELRQVMHDLISLDPVLGYGAELFWRDYYRLLGRRSRESRASESGWEQREETGIFSAVQTDGKILEAFRRRAESLRTRIEELGAIHCTYLIRGNEICRWTATQDGIRREILDGSTEKTQKLVAGAWKMMSAEETNPDMSIRPELLENLRALAQLLLPPEVIQQTGEMSGSTFFITTDGFLSRIPFEAFDVGTDGEYIPLLMCRDVAYLRHADPLIEKTTKDSGIVLVNARPSKELQRRYPFQQELQEALAEGEAVAALSSGATFLAGDSATKSNLTTIWEDASFIYIAAHTLRDPQAPYLMLIPLVTPVEISGPDAAYLDLMDIRMADFSGCNIVVLSGCSSGAPYIEARRVGPSLGDAFLDAGASAVVQTFWDVRDVDARRLMTSYVQTWGSLGSSTIHALCSARRKAFQHPRGAQHPFRWSLYSIKIGRL